MKLIQTKRDSIFLITLGGARSVKDGNITEIHIQSKRIYLAMVPRSWLIPIPAPCYCT